MNLDTQKAFYANKIREGRFDLEDNKTILSLIQRPDYFGLWQQGKVAPPGYTNLFFMTVLDATKGDCVGLFDSYMGTELFRGVMNDFFSLEKALISRDGLIKRPTLTAVANVQVRIGAFSYVGKETDSNGVQPLTFGVVGDKTYDSIYRQLRSQNTSEQSIDGVVKKIIVPEIVVR